MGRAQLAKKKRGKIEALKAVAIAKRDYSRKKQAYRRANKMVVKLSNKARRAQVASQKAHLKWAKARTRASRKAAKTRARSLGKAHKKLRKAEAKLKTANVELAVAKERAWKKAAKAKAKVKENNNKSRRIKRVLKSINRLNKAK